MERIKVFVAADKSAFVRLYLILHYDKDQCLSSNPIDIHIQNPRKYSFLHRAYEGTEIFPEEIELPREEMLNLLRGGMGDRIYDFEF